MNRHTRRTISAADREVDHDALMRAAGSTLDAAHRWGRALGDDRVLLVLDDEGITGRRIRQGLPVGRARFVDQGRVAVAVLSRAELTLMLPLGTANQLFEDAAGFGPKVLVVVIVGIAGLAIYGHEVRGFVPAAVPGADPDGVA